MVKKAITKLTIWCPQEHVKTYLDKGFEIISTIEVKKGARFCKKEGTTQYILQKKVIDVEAVSGEVL